GAHANRSGGAGLDAHRRQIAANGFVDEDRHRGHGQRVSTAQWRRRSGRSGHTHATRLDRMTGSASRAPRRGACDRWRTRGCRRRRPRAGLRARPGRTDPSPPSLAVMAIDFTLPPDIEEIRRRVREFVDGEVKPAEQKLEEAGNDRKAVIEMIMDL